MLGTIMAANVFFVIIPAQWELIRAKEAGREPDPARALRGKQRSVHNNYLTLPVLFAMLEQPLPVDVRTQLVVADADRADDDRRLDPALLQPAPRRADGVVDPGHRGARHRSGRGRDPAGRRLRFGGAAATAVSIARAHAIVQARCVPCHSAHPTRMDSAPLGIVFDTPEQMHAQASLIEQVAVSTKTMPLGNATGMTQAERDELGAWIRQGAKIK